MRCTRFFFSFFKAKRLFLSSISGIFFPRPFLLSQLCQPLAAGRLAAPRGFHISHKTSTPLLQHQSTASWNFSVAGCVCAIFGENIALRQWCLEMTLISFFCLLILQYFAEVKHQLFDPCDPKYHLLLFAPQEREGEIQVWPNFNPQSLGGKGGRSSAPNMWKHWMYTCFRRLKIRSKMR